MLYIIENGNTVGLISTAVIESLLRPSIIKPSMHIFLSGYQKKNPNMHI